jgi:anti-sigma28 factor (negative regulator of flagellin synthesis)
MNIEKTHGPDGLAPKSVQKAVSKKTSAPFSESLKKALHTQKSRATSASIDTQKLKEVKERIANGFYDRPENLSTIAEKLISKGKIV